MGIKSSGQNKHLELLVHPSGNVQWIGELQEALWIGSSVLADDRGLSYSGPPTE